MANEFAIEFSQTLDELRVELLGADAAIKLLSDGDTGFDEIVEITRSFYLKRRASVSLGAEFIELKIAQFTADGDDNVTLEEIRATVAVEYRGERYKAQVIDETINAMKVFLLRLTDKVE